MKSNQMRENHWITATPRFGLFTEMFSSRCNCKSNKNISVRFYPSIHSIRNKEKNFCFEIFCPQLKEHFGRPLRLKKCLYGADISGKSWYETLDNFLDFIQAFIQSVTKKRIVVKCDKYSFLCYWLNECLNKI